MIAILTIILLQVTSINLPKNLKDQSKSGKLSNNLEYFLLSCSNCEKIGVALSIKVGTLQDPIPGLTHLLEHMLFYSTSSYPSENHLLNFIQLHSGSINAYTSLDHSCFFYSINKDLAEDSLKIFSSSFHEAIFNLESIKREIQAVDSEHSKNKFTDSWQEFRLLQILLGENRLGEFSTGNFISLNVDGIEKLVEEQYWRFYVGDNMKLVIYGNFTGLVMENWVSLYFSKVRKGRRKREFGAELNGFLGGNNGTVGVRQKFGDGCSMDVVYLVSSEYEYAGNAPAHFLAYLLNNQGKTGFKGNFFTIQDFTVDISDNFESFSLVQLSFTLSDHNLFADILGAISSFLAKIKETPEKDLKRVFADYKKLLQLHFDYSQIPDAEEIAKLISANMQFFTEEFYYSGFSLVQEFDYDYFLDVISQMQWVKPYVIMSCDYFQGCFEFLDFKVDLNKRCSFYEMNYEILELNVHLKEYSGFEIYEENKYLLHGIKLESESNSSIELGKNTGYELWYKFNSQLGIPKAGISFCLRLENWSQSELLIEILLAMTKMDLEYNNFLFLLSGYSFSYQVNHGYAILHFSGWNTELFPFFNTVVQILKSPNSSFYSLAVFKLIEKYSAFYYSQLYEQSQQVFEDFMYGSDNTVDVKLEKLKSIQFGNVEVLSFSKAFLKVLVWGNVHLPQEFYEEFKLRLGVEEIIQYQPNLTQVSKEGKLLKNPSEENYCLYFSYTLGQFDLNTWTSLLILQRIADDRAFRILRTKFQLGYIVYISISSMFNTNSLKLIIQGSKKDPKEAEKKIEEFWKDFEIEENEFVVAKEYVAKELNEPVKGLEQWQQEIWKEIYLGRYLFDIKSLIVEKLKDLRIWEVYRVLAAVRSGEFVVKVQYLNEANEVLVSNNGN